MAVFSEVRRSHLFGASRLDAECYTPELIQAYDHLESISHARLGDHAKITDGQHGYHKVDPSSPIRHLTARCIKAFFIDDSQAERLSAETHEKNLRSALAVNDVLLSTAGTLGNAGIVTQDVLPANIDQDVARIQLCDEDIDPWYLVAFLDSRIGRLQSERVSTGQVQKHIALEKVREFLIPISVDQKGIGNKVREAFECRGNEVKLYAQAELVLLEELGLDKLDPSPVLFYERRFSETRQAGRFDAEYFQPRFQKAFHLLGNQKRTIGDVAKLAKRRFVPKRGTSFHYIEIGDVADCGSIESQEVAGENAPSRATWIVQPGDVITSTVRPIRRLSALIELSQSGYVCSSGFAVLIPQTVPSELLLVYLRLPLIAEILDLHCSASMYPSISTNDLLHIPFRKPSDAAVEAIKTMVHQSRAARAESRRLLNDAKKMVEKAVLEG